MQAQHPEQLGQAGVGLEELAGFHVDEEIADRSGVTKIIGYPSASFVQGNIGAENDYLRDEAIESNVG
ncbi:MAG: hypothetical protein ABI409_16495, partial [Ramlibacter sp.]